MGLNERKVLTEFKETKLNQLIAELSAASGIPNLPVEIDWASIGEPDLGMSDSYSDAIDSIYFRPAIDAFKQICVDDMGKKAVKDGLKAIRFMNQNKRSSMNAELGMSVKEGVFTIDLTMYAGIEPSYLKMRTAAAVKVLSNNL